MDSLYKASPNDAVLTATH